MITVTEEPAKEMKEMIALATRSHHRPLVDRLAAAISKMETVPKNGERGGREGYKYATADDVYAACRVALAGEGVVIRQQEISQVTDDTYTGTNGKKIFFTYHLWFECAGEQEERDVRQIAVVVYGVQGYQAAATYALKYWLRSRLLLPTGEPDLDESQPEAPQPQQQRAKPALEVVIQGDKVEVKEGGRVLSVADIQGRHEEGRLAILREVFTLLSRETRNRRTLEEKLALARGADSLAKLMPPEAQRDLARLFEKEGG